MAKNYENENKTGNYSADKTSGKNAMTARTTEKTALKTKLPTVPETATETKHPVLTMRKKDINTKE